MSYEKRSKTPFLSPLLFRELYPGEYFEMLQTYQHQVFDFTESQSFNFNKFNNIDLNDCLKELAKIEAKLADNHSFGLVRCEVQNQLTDITHTNKQPYTHPHTLVLIVIEDTTSEWLVSGAYHSGAGTLDEAGQDLLEIFDYALAELQKSGNYTVEEAVHIRDLTHNIIKNR